MIAESERKIIRSSRVTLYDNWRGGSAVLTCPTPNWHLLHWHSFKQLFHWYFIVEKKLHISSRLFSRSYPGQRSMLSLWISANVLFPESSVKAFPDKSVQCQQELHIRFLRAQLRKSMDHESGRPELEKSVLWTKVNWTWSIEQNK